MQVMIVSNLDDESLNSCVTEIESAGADVVRMADVYSATARLASPHSIQHVVVDVRALDNLEIQFLNLATRYFPTLEFSVPDLDGTSQRTASLAEPIKAVDVSAIAGAIRQDTSISESGAESESASAAPVRDESPAPDADLVAEAAGIEVQAARLSTDGGPEDAGTGPALHEAVRMRMAGGQAAPVRRAPPRQAEDSVAEDSEAKHSPATAVDASVSAEEVKALLGRDEVDDEVGHEGGHEGGDEVGDEVGDGAGQDRAERGGAS